MSCNLCREDCPECGVLVGIDPFPPHRPGCAFDGRILACPNAAVRVVADRMGSLAICEDHFQRYTAELT